MRSKYWMLVGWWVAVLLCVDAAWGQLSPRWVSTLAGSAGLSGTTDGTGSAARFYSPGGVTADTNGNVYVADTYNHAIRKITSAGKVTTFAGVLGFSGTNDATGTYAQFNYPFSVATDTNGNVYVADTYNYTIRKITSAGVVTTLAGSAGDRGSADGTGSVARFYLPYGVAADVNGTVYVADTYNHTIRKITLAGVVTTLVGSAGNHGSADGTGSDARFYFPYGVAVDINGNVYVGDTYNYTIRKITSAGVVTTLAGWPGYDGSTDAIGSAARFYHPTGVAADLSGNVYVGDTYNHTIRKVTSASVVSTIAGSAGYTGSVDGQALKARFNHPFGVAADASGSVLYVADWSNYTIRKIRPFSLAAALNQIAWVVTQGGSISALWYEQDSNTHDNVSAIQSGALADGSNSWVETSLTGPGKLSFWWKVSCAGPGGAGVTDNTTYDRLWFALDDTIRYEISGETDWRQQACDIPFGAHTVRWGYSKDGSGSAGADAGWIDEVGWTPSTAPFAPDIKANDQDGAVAVQRGSNLVVTVALTVGGEGEAPSGDWWAAAKTPYGWYYYASGWASTVGGLTPLYQGSATNVSAQTILDINTSKFDKGSYTFHFGLDTTQDGVLTLETLTYDSVDVTLY